MFTTEDHNILPSHLREEVTSKVMRSNGLSPFWRHIPEAASPQLGPTLEWDQASVWFHSMSPVIH